MVKLGIIRETKNPPDRRVPLTPEQCRRLLDDNPDLDIVVQPSPIRCFSDREYADLGIPLDENLSACDVLMGVKAVSYTHLRAHETS